MKEEVFSVILILNKLLPNDLPLTGPAASNR